MSRSSFYPGNTFSKFQTTIQISNQEFHFAEICVWMKVRNKQLLFKQNLVFLYKNTSQQKP